MDQLPEQYEFLSVIASGGMGIIYEAKHLALNQRVAIKMMKAQRLDGKHVKRFRKEADALAALEHPNIIHVRHYGFTDNGQPYMVLDYVEGTSMAQIIQSRGPIPVAFAVEFFTQVADALAHAHERGILHQDLKPSNIMVCDSGSQPPFVKLIDFGIAKIVNGEATPSGRTDTGDVMGSPAYMSPEQANGGRVDARTDIYSLGCVMFEVLTGTQPFTGATALEVIAHQINTKAPSLQERSISDFPPRLVQIVARTLEKNPDNRFQSMPQLRDALVSVFEKHGDADEEAAPHDSSEQKKTSIAVAKSTRRFVLAGIVMSLLIICANVTVLISKANKEKEVALEHKKIKEDADAAGHYDIDGTARRLIRDGLNRSDSDGKFSLKFENDDSVMDELAKYPARAYSIDLTNSSVKGPGLAFLIRYPVRFLSLNDSNLTDRGLLEVKHLKKLEELQIDNSSITRDGLKELKNLPKLRRLSARSDRIDDAALNNIKDIASLEYLQCGRNETLTAAGYGHLKTMKNLNTLDVMENHIDVNSAQEISQLPHIAWINLDSTDVDDAGLKALSKMSKLKHLDLPNCKKVSRTGLNYLSRLPNLQHIKLEEDRQLKDEDFEFIKKCPALKFLDIRSSNAGDKTMETVGDSKIESLYIQNTKITDKGFLSILKDKHLKNVEIEHTQFSQQARDQFNAQRPGVLKYFDIDRSPF